MRRKEVIVMSAKISAMLCIITLMISACASQPLPPPKWSYEKDAVQVHLKADPKLNFDEGVPHTLLVCLYQLKDPNAFNQLADDTDGIYKLLECGLFDAGVATSKRLIVNPGKDVTMTLDRAEGAKYVAAVAGYYTLQKERMIRMYDIPVVIEKKGFFTTTKIAKPGVLKIELELGPTQIK
jgi:type VI secretion system VasD/TssJ family lipoprotein